MTWGHVLGTQQHPGDPPRPRNAGFSITGICSWSSNSFSKDLLQTALPSSVPGKTGTSFLSQKRRLFLWQGTATGGVSQALVPEGRSLEKNKQQWMGIKSGERQNIKIKSKEMSLMTIKKKEKCFWSTLLLVSLVNVELRQIMWWVEPRWELSPAPQAWAGKAE